MFTGIFGNWKIYWNFYLNVCFPMLFLLFCSGNKDANRLFEDLLADYNKLVRPVDNNSETLIVRFKLKLSQLLDVVSFSSNKFKFQ